MDVQSPLIGAATAIAICAVNTLLGYIVTKKALGRELNVFLAVVFGSMAVRGVAVITGAWFCLSVLRMHQVVFSLTFAVVCFVMLMGEILFFHQSFERSKRQVRRPVTELLKKNAERIVELFIPAVPVFA